jgi:Cu-Zn family superoxide dismutase
MKKIVMLAAAAMWIAACGPKKTSNGGTSGGTPTPAPTAAMTMKKAGGKIEAKSTSKVGGDVTFASTADNKVMVTVHVTGATPGDHGVHLHEKGDCSAADASSAGGHFNPTSQAHGAPMAEHHHAGDFGNLKVGADGTGTLTLTVSDLTVDNGPNGVVGKSLVIHEKADDMTTQPSGNSGARQGCAVINAM